MGNKLAIIAIEVLEVMFFLGLAGCVLAVLFSWVSVLKGCFMDKE